MKYSHGKIAPSFVLSDEGMSKRIFDNRDDYNIAKVFLEGNGLITELKNRNP